MTHLVFLDLETTGLDPERHSVWEIAWAVEDGRIRSGVVAHDLLNADPAALEVNRYWERVRGADPLGAPQTEALLRRDLEGATVVGSNPAFDTAFLRKRWGRAPWHYRLFDVAAYAAGVLGLDRPPSLRDIVAALRDRGWGLPDPDHTAAGDVAVLRDVFSALRMEAS